MSRRSNYILLSALLLLTGILTPTLAQNPPQPKGPMVGPPSPQSKHYPILLLAFGNDPNWSLRVGLKGPERLDRPGYPPIPLEPAEVTYEAAADSWTYHARDSQTGAAVLVHLSREACTDAQNDTLTPTTPPGSKFPFRASVDHPQIGNLKGCARIAAELFPKINNRPDEDEDETEKNKPPAPTVTNFKSPVAVAFVDSQGRVVMKRGSVAHVAAPDGVPLSVSRDGKQLLYRRLDPDKKPRSFIYDFAAAKSSDVSNGEVADAFWSPDDAHIALSKFADSKWGLYIAPVGATDQAIPVYTSDILELQGWADQHSVLVKDPIQATWIADDGKVQSTLPIRDLLGESFAIIGGDTIRVHPLNPDLLLVAAQKMPAAAGTSKSPVAAPATGIFLYEIRSKRRVTLNTPDLGASNPEWSRDGLQIFFTGTGTGLAKRRATYRIFWDGTGLQKYSSGTHLVIGQ